MLEKERWTGKKDLGIHGWVSPAKQIQGLRVGTGCFDC